jgi:hypothetical protein
MSTKFSMSGGEVYQVQDISGELLNEIPVGVYSLAYNSGRACFYLLKEDDFTIPKKLFGDTIRHRDRIVDTFRSRNGNTGVLLAGAQGSGKSLLAKAVAIKANLPVIKITSAHSGDKFIQFLDQIQQEIVIVFDEFEKVYHKKEDQDLILTIFDGLSHGRRLFIATVNDAYKISEFMINRPGRFYYKIDFASLSNEAIEEYCKDRLGDDSDFANEIISLVPSFKLFSFDMLAAICEERLRHKESFDDIVKILNVKPLGRIERKYRLKLIDRRTKKEIPTLSGSVWGGEPLGQYTACKVVISGADIDSEMAREIKAFCETNLLKNGDDEDWSGTVGNPAAKVDMTFHLNEGNYIGSLNGDRTFKHNSLNYAVVVNDSSTHHFHFGAF